MSVAVSAELRDLFAWAAASDDRSFRVLNGRSPLGGGRGYWSVEVVDHSDESYGIGQDRDRSTAISSALTEWQERKAKLARDEVAIAASRKDLGF